MNKICKTTLGKWVSSSCSASIFTKSLMIYLKLFDIIDRSVICMHCYLISWYSPIYWYLSRIFSYVCVERPMKLYSTLSAVFLVAVLYKITIFSSYGPFGIMIFLLCLYWTSRLPPLLLIIVLHAVCMKETNNRLLRKEKRATPEQVITAPFKKPFCAWCISTFWCLGNSKI